MIDPKEFYDALSDRGITFFTGVPDSLLKDFCAYVQDTAPDDRHVIAANEGGAVALAAGFYLASGSPAAVYMQNSGIGNAINPLVSLTDPAVYSIPVLLIIGWRGEPGVKDAPQHVKQGEVTPTVLDAVGIGYSIVSKDTDVVKTLDQAVSEMLKRNGPYALIIRKGTFQPYKLKHRRVFEAELEREQAIGMVAAAIGPDAVVVSTTGKISRELYEIRESRNEPHGRDFHTVGSMGHCSQIAAGVALAKPDCEVYCFDGDGAVIMHMGSLSIIGSLRLGNFKHVVFNNAAHDSVGGQPTVGNMVNFSLLASACGYRMVETARTKAELESALARLAGAEGPALLEVVVRPGARPDLGRPKEPPTDMKQNFMAEL
jgi:phosphonopyruvate decarboxylase